MTSEAPIDEAQLEPLYAESEPGISPSGTLNRGEGHGARSEEFARLLADMKGIIVQQAEVMESMHRALASLCHLHHRIPSDKFFHGTGIFDAYQSVKHEPHQPEYQPVLTQYEIPRYTSQHVKSEPHQAHQPELVEYEVRSVPVTSESPQTHWWPRYQMYHHSAHYEPPYHPYYIAISNRHNAQRTLQPAQGNTLNARAPCFHMNHDPKNACTCN
jgi:hypothetical protein